MKHFIDDVTEHSLMKVLGGLALLIGFGLDAINKTEYYKWALIFMAIVVFFIVIRVVITQKMYKYETLPIPIVISFDSNTTTTYALDRVFETLEEKSQFKNLKVNLKRYRNVVEEDLAFTYNGDIYDKERILSFIQIIRYQIRKIKENTPNKVEFHLAYFGRPAFLNEQQTKYKHITIAHAMPEALGVMLGMAVGNYWSLMVTQYNRGDYLEVMNTNDIKCFF